MNYEQVLELRIRVVDLFADFDKLRSGHVPRVTFRRALCATKLDLQESELSQLEDRYACACVSLHFAPLGFPVAARRRVAFVDESSAV